MKDENLVAYCGLYCEPDIDLVCNELAKVIVTKVETVIGK